MLIERLMKIALFGSEWVLYLLIALSVLSFATMCERFYYLGKRRANLPELRRKLLDHLSEDDLDGARATLTESTSFEARVLRQALLWVEGGAEAMTDAMESELLMVRKELERGLNFLGTLGNNAPFVGLFGTVLGVIIAFHALGDAGKNASQMDHVMASISEALVATGVGLFVALPAVVAYNIIQKRILDVEADAQSLTKLLTAYVKTRAARAQISPEVESAEPSSDAVQSTEKPELSVSAA